MSRTFGCGGHGVLVLLALGLVLPFVVTTFFVAVRFAR